ncbi:MAG: DUF1284 domain-containing protein [Eubacterium sp.]|nr:DUF1284 domain-containing protein [Eubacterium sp.]
MLRLRAHHLNCIPRFCGRGYSEAFCKNMQSIKERFISGEAYEIVSSADDVCRFCPNLMNGVCRDNEKVCRFDRLTEEFGTNDISKICADCQWYSICEKV